MKNSKNNNIILGFGYWVFEFGFSWCKGKIINDDLFIVGDSELEPKQLILLKSNIFFTNHAL